jgi:hypothetical protein
MFCNTFFKSISGETMFCNTFFKSISEAIIFIKYSNGAREKARFREKHLKEE